MFLKKKKEKKSIFPVAIYPPLPPFFLLLVCGHLFKTALFKEFTQETN